MINYWVQYMYLLSIVYMASLEPGVTAEHCLAECLAESVANRLSRGYLPGRGAIRSRLEPLKRGFIR
jgi:hypothetical protein